TVPVARRDNVLTVPNAALRFRPNLSEAEQQALREKMDERRKQREAERNQNGQAGEQGQKSENHGQNNPAAPDGKRGGANQGNPTSGQSGGGAQGNAAGGQAGGGDGNQRRQGQMVWILVGAKNIEPRFVRTGLTNGRVTEIVSGDLHEGDIVVTGQNDAT